MHTATNELYIDRKIDVLVIYSNCTGEISGRSLILLKENYKELEELKAAYKNLCDKDLIILGFVHWYFPKDLLNNPIVAILPIKGNQEKIELHPIMWGIKDLYLATKNISTPIKIAFPSLPQNSCLSLGKFNELLKNQYKNSKHKSILYLVL